MADVDWMGKKKSFSLLLFGERENKDTPMAIINHRWLTWMNICQNNGWLRNFLIKSTTKYR